MKYLIISVCLVLYCYISIGEAKYIGPRDLLEKYLADDLLQYLNSGNQTSFLQKTLREYQFPKELRTSHIYELPERSQTITCKLCRVAFDIILFFKKARLSDAEFQEKAISLCGILGVGERVVCNKVILFNLRQVLYILAKSPNLNSEIVCGTVFQDSCTYDNVGDDWSIKIDPNGQQIRGPKDQIPNTGPNDLTVVHITDTHWDPKYIEGGNAECNYPMCCRGNQGNLQRPEAAAGYWGDYRVCDLPWYSVDNVFEEIKKNHEKIDIIYVTGDYVDHGVWDTSVSGNKRIIEKTIQGIRKTFPNVAIYPAVGNHEPHPVNLFSPNDVAHKSFSTKRIYEFMASQWDWLPKDARETIAFGGYYTTLVRPGLRVIAMNNNLCNTYNFWILYQQEYLAEELQWIHDQLLEAEKNGEKVHLLGHMASGEGDCFNTWGREFRRIVDRFWNTISGQFIGHTHRDEFNIHYSRDDPSHAINVVWNGGSATSYSFVNPNYRIYTVDPATYQVIDHETWIYNMTTANANPSVPPQWFQEYSFRNEYGIQDLSPASLDKLVTRFATESNTFETYWRNYVKNGDPRLELGCDQNCYADLLCKIVTTEYKDRTKCEQLLALFKQDKMNKL